MNTSKSRYFYKITCKELQNYVERDEKLLEKAKTEVKKNDTDDQIQRTYLMIAFLILSWKSFINI